MLPKHCGMSEYPHSPYGQARQLVAELDEGRLTPEEFLLQLDRFGQRVDQWRAQLDAIKTGDDYPEGQELVDDARESLQAVTEGAELLREYAETRAEETSAEALDLMAEASEFLAQLLGITERNMEDLEDLR
jgi:hypothetical protein